MHISIDGVPITQRLGRRIIDKKPTRLPNRDSINTFKPAAQRSVVAHQASRPAPKRKALPRELTSEQLDRELDDFHRKFTSGLRI